MWNRHYQYLKRIRYGKNLENTILSSRFAAFDNRLQHIPRLHCLDIPMIKFVDESGNINPGSQTHKLFRGPNEDL